MTTSKQYFLEQLTDLIALVQKLPDDTMMIRATVEFLNATIEGSHQMNTRILINHGIETIGTVLGSAVETENYIENYQKFFVSCSKPIVEILQLERKALSEEATA